MKEQVGNFARSAPHYKGDGVKCHTFHFMTELLFLKIDVVKKKKKVNVGSLFIHWTPVKPSSLNHSYCERE